MRKKLIFFTNVFLLLSYPLSLSSAAYDAKIDGVYYKFDYANNTATVTRYRDDCNYHVSYPDSVVYVPSKVTYGGKDFVVNSVESCCFRDSYMKRVILPNTIRSIGSSAFFISNVEDVIIPSGTQFVGGDLVRDCSYIKYIEIGENVSSINNLGSLYQKANNRYFHNDITVKWNAINCQNFELGTGEYLYDFDDYYYPDASTPFWKGSDDYHYEGRQKSGWTYKDVYSIPGNDYVMKHHIIEFKFGQKVEHIPAYLCYNLQRLQTITIPRNVLSIGKQAFGKCASIRSVTIEALIPPSGNGGLSTNVVVYVPCSAIEAYRSSSDWSKYNLQINPYSYESTSTSAIITFGCKDTDISSLNIQGGKASDGNMLEFIGLEPNSEYADIPVVLTKKTGEKETIKISFSTTSLTLNTLQSKSVSSTTAILLAETNMSDAEVNCGFEWKRNDSPADMEGNKVYCPVASGQMAGRLKGLKDDVYYKYRAFYQSTAGNMYYGDWQYIFTGDVAAGFDPILYTYGATVVRENEATISGYALAGSEDFTEQGFEYWAESRTNGGANAPHRVPAALNEHFFVQASGIALRATLTNLDAGTVYKYRVYGKVGDQYYYGAEQSFATQGEYEGDDSEAIEEVPSDQVPSTKAQKILINGEIFILRGDKVYTITGQEVK